MNLCPFSLRQALTNLSLGIVLVTGATAAVSNTNPGRNAFSQALERAGKDVAVPFALNVRCIDDDGLRSFALYPSGALVWGERRQARIDAGLRKALLDDIAAAGFSGFKALYGGQNKPSEAKAPLKVGCRVTAEVDGNWKSSSQAAGGEQHAPLLELARTLLDRAEPLGANGITAANLPDALDKLADGTLAPETLSLRLSSFESAQGASPGTLLRFDGGQRTLSRYIPGTAPATPNWRQATPEEWTRAIDALVSADFASLPGNVPGPALEEVQVTVLGHRHTVAARAFTRNGVDELVDEGERFARLVEALLREGDD